VGATQSIPGAKTARTQAAAAADGSAAAGPASGTQAAVPPATGAQPTTGTQPASGAQSASGAQVASGAAKAAGAQSAAGAAKSGSGSGQKAARGPRRARLQLRHIDTFSALKISLVLSIAMFFIWMVAVGVLYGVLSGLGVFDTLNDLFGQLGTASGTDGRSEVITPGIVFGGAAVIGAINIVLMTALCTVAAFIYNMCSDLVGGLEVTLSERD
jgi:cobalamin biosynthesis Mg chelatase CobN